MVVNRFSSHCASARTLAALFLVVFAFCCAAPRAAAQNESASTRDAAANANAAASDAAAVPALPDVSQSNAPDASTRGATSNAQIAPSISLVPGAALRVAARSEAPLFWAEGVARASELDEYAATGLTAVVVRLAWRGENIGAGENAFEADFALPRAFAEAAARRGLRVIYAFPAAPAGENELRIAGDNEAYAHLWESFASAAMDALKTTPNLAGWMLPNDARALSAGSEAGFSRWLFANYADVRVLNAQWLTNFGSLDDVTLAASQQVAANWKKRRDAVTPETRADAPDTIWPFHPAALALSHYRLDAHRALVSRWARIAKTLDNSHPLFSGALPDYAQMLALPPQVDVSIPAVFPGVGENDFLTHNPQAVDVARRGNRFRAVAMLNTSASTRASANRDNSSSPALPQEALAQLLPHWCREALLHGASGLAFSSWDGLFENDDARRALRETLKNLQSETWRDLWNTPPIATTAVVLTPLADGYTREAARPRGLYGFGENLVFGEPSNLVYALRLGTSFGGIDFLAPEDVESSDSTGNSETASLPNDAPQYSLDETAVPKTSAAPLRIDSRRAPLSRYGALLLPQALSVSPAFSDALGKYAAGGGIVVADLGFGAMQNGGRVLGMPPALANLFGVAPPRALTDFGFNLRAGETSPLLPSWSRALEGALRGGFLTSGDNRGAAFSGPAILGGALPEGTTQLGFAPAPRELELGDSGVSLSLKPRGEGALIFAPFFLWRDWRPDHLGFAALHGDLMVRRAAMLHISAPAIVPAPGPLSGGVPLAPEVVNYENALVLVNHLPPLPLAPTRASTRNAPAVFSPAASVAPAAFPFVAAKALASTRVAFLREKTATAHGVKRTSANLYGNVAAFAPTPFSKLQRAPSFARQWQKPSPVEAQLSVASDASANTRDALSSRDVGTFAAVLREREAHALRLLSSRNVLAPTLIAARKRATTRNPKNAPRVLPSATALPAPAKNAAPKLQNPVAPAAAPTPPGLQLAVVQTAGADGFLWNDALCAFDAASTRAPQSFAIARPLPIAASLSGEVAPRTVTLHARVLAAQTLVLKMLPVRAQNLEGGSLVARVMRFESARAEIVLWPNVLSIAPASNGDFAVAPGAEAALQVTIYDSQNGYRVRPNSRHRITASELSTPLLPNGKRESASAIVTADALGRVVINAGGTAPIIEIEPLF